MQLIVQDLSQNFRVPVMTRAAAFRTLCSLYTHLRLSGQRMGLIDRVKVSHPTRHNIVHFGDAILSKSTNESTVHYALEPTRDQRMGDDHLHTGMEYGTLHL